MRAVSADHVAGRSGAADTVVVKLDLAFFAPDDVLATRLYNDLVNTLEEADWCAGASRCATRVLDDGSGIWTDGFTVRVAPGEVAEVSRDVREPTDVEVRLRLAAQADGASIGQIDTLSASRVPSKGVQDLEYKVKPTERRGGFSWARILRFLSEVENDELRLVCTSIKLSPGAKLKPSETPDPDDWTFEADVTLRRAAR